MTEERADRLSSPSPSPDAAYADQRFDDDVERALATLPPDFRAAVVLCDVEGLSYEEIAEILDAKLGTVRSRIHRGRSMLRKALAHRAPQAGRARYSGPTSDPTRGGRRPWGARS
jgi:RNA polymerase sigma-70 factor (ECF subfamily)